MNVVRRIIAAKKFNDGTKDGVADEIGGEHLAVKFFMPEQPGEAEVKGEIQQGIVNFRRMYGCAAGRMVGWKPDGPRQAARAAVATAIQQAADAAKDVSERDARPEHVGGFPQRKFFPTNVNHACNRRADEAAVINEAAMLNHENFPERLVGEFVLPISCHVNGARAENRAEHKPEHDVGDFFAGDVFAPGAAGGRPKPRQECQRDHHAIPMNREGAELKRNRMHGGKLRCGGGNGNLNSPEASWDWWRPPDADSASDRVLSVFFFSIGVSSKNWLHCAVIF